ncbi:MAG: protein kinase, partial [Gemmatimonadota bacterium]
MATVYLAEDVKHHRKVAIKVLRPELAAVIGGERFLREIQTIAALQHPHILGLIDSGTAKVEGRESRVEGGAEQALDPGPSTFVYYVMPFVDGESLRDRLTREKQLPIPDAVRIATEVSGALDYAHRHGVIHRDIKPENILLHDGSALVADFGIALAVSSAGSGSRMTETGMSLGTPHYMSPEQAMGEREITARSDVYALGCVTYEMLIGDPPFTGSTAQAIVAKVMTAEPAGLTAQRKSVPLAVEDAVLTALQKLPADRFASAAEFASALEGAGRVGAGRRPARIQARRALPPRPPAPRLLYLALAVCAILAAWGWMRARSAADRPVERRYISLGDSVQLQTSATTAGPPLALSPDGSRLAFVGDSLSRIWIKRRDALEPVVLQGTEHGGSPTFSPDGQWLAYTAEHHLKKIRVEGGASITIADSVGTGFGLAWLDDGTLVYSNLSLLGLRRVGESGGPSTAVLADSVFKGLAPMLPTPLPHARGVLFQVCGSGCVTMGLHVLDLKTGQHKLLVADASMGWYLPSGRLLYVRRDGVALVVPFDLGKLEIHGAAIPVLQGIGQTLAFARLAWSASGTLVYESGLSGTALVTLQRQTRTGRPIPFDPSWTGEFNSFALAPDGKRAAIGITTPGAGLDIWIKQLDRGPLTRLTSSGRDRRPAWSPDGRQIAFVRDSGSGGDIYLRAADGGGVDRRPVHLDRATQEVAWSPDGRWI